MTLQEILEAMINQEENWEATSNADKEQIREILGDKVDSYKHIISLCDAEEARLADEIKAFQKSKKTVENARDRIKDTLLYVMKSKNFTKLPGDKFTASIRSRTTSVINRTATEADYIGFDNLVKVAFAWDSDAVKEVAKTDVEVAKLLDEKTTEYVQFTVRKGV
jgi:hypothetical protein